MSRVKDIIKSAGSALLSSVFPMKAVEAVVGSVNALLTVEEKLDPAKVTGVELSDKIYSFPEGVQTHILDLEFDLEHFALESDLEMQQVLADADMKGGSFRPIIALMMAGLLFVGIVAYGFLLWEICRAAGRLPNWEELTIPFGIPFLIVVTYFGFLKKERKELLELILQRTPAGAATVGLANKLQTLAAMSKKP